MILSSGYLYDSIHRIAVLNVHAKKNNQRVDVGSWCPKLGAVWEHSTPPKAAPLSKLHSTNSNPLCLGELHSKKKSYQPSTQATAQLGPCSLTSLPRGPHWFFYPQHASFQSRATARAPGGRGPG